MERHSPQKIITSEIKSESPLLGQDSSCNENNNPNSNEQKIILKNNPRQLKMQNRNEKNELGLISDDTLDHPKPLASDYFDEGKEDLRKILEQKKLIKGKKIVKSQKKENILEGYLDEDLDDDDNKKIYLRVIKRLEKTLGVPVLGIKMTGEPIIDIELEENIRPLILKDFVNNKDNKIGICVNDKKFIINEQNPINNNLNDKKSNNQIVKINEGQILNNIYKNKIFENNKKLTDEYNQQQKKVMNMTLNKNKIQDKNINNIQTREDISQIKNKYINISNRNQQKQNNNNKPIINQQNKQNHKNIKYNNIINNTNNEKEMKYFSNNKPEQSNNERLFTSTTNSYSKMAGFQNNNKNNNSILPIRKISYENSTQNSQIIKKIQHSQRNSIKYNNNNNNTQKINQTNSSNKVEKKTIQKYSSPQNQKYSNLTKTLPIRDYNDNTIVIPDMQRGREVFIKQMESELKTGKIKTQTYERGGKFNNVQTTYVVYSKNINKPGYIKVNRATILDNKNKRLFKTNTDLNSNTPIKTDFIENSFSRINQQLNNTFNKNKNDKSSPFKNYQFNSPIAGINKYTSRINFNKVEENPMNRSQNTLPINRSLNKNEINSNENSLKIRNYININRSLVNSNNKYTKDNKSKKYNISAYNSYHYDNRLDIKKKIH